MTYAERAYFDGDHCQHCADREEHERLERIAALYRKVATRVRFPRVPMPVDCTDAEEFPEIARARAHLAAMDPDKRAELEEGWG